MPDYEDLIAYFSMEIGLEEPMPTYAGGLGILAGDTLKSFADMGMDVVAVTLLSEKGYFYQRLDDSGYQHEKDNPWPINDFTNKLDIEAEVKIEGRTVAIAAHDHYITGINGKKIRILFLDTNLQKNSAEDRKITSYLYGGDLDYRLKQEIILGLGGIKLLRKLNYNPRKFHMNEGHAALLTLELYKELSAEKDFDERIKQVRSRCSFTTHTPVPAGHDAFDKTLIEKYLDGELPREIADIIYENNKFSMTLLALKLSSYVNAVSKKHQEITRLMFPKYNIDYITNGIHANTWVNQHLAELLDKNLPDWKQNTMDLRNVLRIPIQEILKAHKKAKKDLIDYINNHTNAGFDYDIFTIGFARRATAYKRAELLFKDLERLKSINNKAGKLQIVFSGKAHPRDEEGKLIIKRIHEIMAKIQTEINIVFMENYNIHLGKLITSGVDLWLNTPMRPLEASGTSGMKASINGVPTLSILDGWWIEGYIENFTGWAIGEENPKETNQEKINQADAEDMYNKLEKTIIPMFYNNPEGYSKIMRNAIAINGAYFNTNRMAKQYLVRAYARKQND